MESSCGLIAFWGPLMERAFCRVYSICLFIVATNFGRFLFTLAAVRPGKVLIKISLMDSIHVFFIRI